MSIRGLFISFCIFFSMGNTNIILAQETTNSLGANAASVAAAVSTGIFPIDYKIDPENFLQVDVYYGKGEKLTRQVRVASSGEINLAPVGDVAVSGLTVAEVQKKLNRLFDKGELFTPQVSVLVLEYSMVTIMGEVRTPGAYPIKSSMTAVELIALAEGFNESASMNEVKVIHTNSDGTKTVNVVRIYDIMNKSSGENEGLLLRSKDVVIVPKSMVTIVGEVKKPGTFPIKSSLTAVELISLAEGFNEAASTNEVKVIHTNPDGTKTASVVKVFDIMNKSSGDNDSLLLRSNDVVIVPKSTVTIVGEVKKPGAYPIKTSLTAVELVALAEGFNDAASPNEVKIIHTNPDGTKVQRVSPLYDIMNKEATDNDNLLLTSGDVVIVPRSTVTIIGEIMKPGIYPTRGHLTIIDLVALAEGFTKFASPNDVRVVHTDQDGMKVERVVPFQDIIKRGDTGSASLLLYSGDVVFVR